MGEQLERRGGVGLNSISERLARNRPRLSFQFYLGSCAQPGPIMRPNVSAPLIFFVTLMLASPVLADGFSLDWFLKNEPHTILELSATQAESVGRFRRLELSQQQRTLVRGKSGKAPRVLGVESPGEADCSCHVSSAFWLDDRQVVVWTERLKYDQFDSKIYHQIRMRPGYFVMDVRGQLYAAGNPISLQEFESRIALPQKARGYSQMSLPPNPPLNIERKLRRLQKRYYFSFRL